MIQLYNKYCTTNVIKVISDVVVYILILQTGQKKATIDKNNKDYKCFQHAVTVALIYKEIKWNAEQFWNIKPFINEYKWKGINYPSKIDDWKTFEKNNPTIALNILYIKGKEICPAYISKIDPYCEKQLILLMIPNEEKEGWHYPAVKNYLDYLEK